MASTVDMRSSRRGRLLGCWLPLPPPPAPPAPSSLEGTAAAILYRGYEERRTGERRMFEGIAEEFFRHDDHRFLRSHRARKSPKSAPHSRASAVVCSAPPGIDSFCAFVL